MKKSLFTLCIALLSAVGGHAQTTYFQTGFDGGMPEGVSTYDLDGRTPSVDMKNLGFEVGKGWIVNKGVDPENTNNEVAISTSWYKNAGQSNDWMVLPAITVNSAKAVLTFRAMARDKQYRDGFKIYVSEKGGQPSDFTNNPILTVSQENHGWTKHSVDLSAFVGKTVYIAFVNDSKDKAALYVDDIFVGVPSHVTFSINMGKSYDGYGEIPVSIKVAAKDKAVNGFTFSLKGTQDGNEVSASRTFTASEATIQVGDTVSFDSIVTVSVPRNKKLTWTASVKSEGDEMELTGSTWAFPWRVVAEETTGTWCQYCVRGIGAMEWMKENYPDGFIGIAVHNSNEKSNVPDSMHYEYYIDAIHEYLGSAGYPHACVNRDVSTYGDPADIPAIYKYFKRNNNNITGVQLQATYDRNSNKIHAVTDLYFGNKVSGAAYKLAYVVIENNVHRTHAETGILHDYCGYDQMNAYAGGENGAMYGFENKPAVLNADSMWYQDVARLIAPSFTGIENVTSSEINEGDHFTNQYELDMPATVLKKENTQLVVLLLDKNGLIANADRVDITGTSVDGIDQIETKKASDDSNAYYNLRGERVIHPSHGIYIHGGKKITL
ncbi:MAG: choice-of-anchor J domain-containing protein [Prevotellaceae bacterium]|nr:choice-of-anchor J domain-containing protein [Prevotellaceae bacterium]